MRGAMESADILSRIDELLGLGNANTSLNAPELSQGCVSLLSLVYGQKSTQVQQFNTSLADIAKEKAGVGYKNQQVVVAAQGTLRNLKREIEAGLTGILRHQITGEVLSDLIQLARAVLEQPGESAKNVASVRPSLNCHSKLSLSRSKGHLKDAFGTL
jgi:hypothetical protein